MTLQDKVETASSALLYPATAGALYFFPDFCSELTTAPALVIAAAGGTALYALERVHIHYDQIRESMLERLLFRTIPITAAVGIGATAAAMIYNDSDTARAIAGVGIAAYGCSAAVRSIEQTKPRTKVSRHIYRATLAAIAAAAFLPDCAHELLYSPKTFVAPLCRSIENVADTHPFFEENMCPALTAAEETGISAAVLLAIAAEEYSMGKDQPFTQWGWPDRLRYFTSKGKELQEKLDEEDKTYMADTAAFAKRMRKDGIIDWRVPALIRQYNLDSVVNAVEETIAAPPEPIPQERAAYAELLENTRPLRAAIYAQRLAEDGTLPAGDAFILELDAWQWIYDATAQLEFQLTEGGEKTYSFDTFTIDGNAYAVLSSDFNFPEQDARLTITYAIPGRKLEREYTIHITERAFVEQDIYLDGVVPQDTEELDTGETGMLVPLPFLATMFGAAHEAPSLLDGYTDPLDTVCHEYSLGAYRTYFSRASTRDGRRHLGVDCPAEMGAPVYAAMSGEVKLVGRDSTRGNFIYIYHGFGVTTTYRHLSEQYVDNREPVHVAEEIGAVGSTGVSTGPHLHFQAKHCDTSRQCMAMNPVSLEIVNVLKK